MLHDLWVRARRGATGPLDFIARLFGLVVDTPTIPGDLRAELQMAEIKAQAEAIILERPIRLAVIALNSVVVWLYLPWHVVAFAVSGVLLSDRAEIWLLTQRRPDADHSMRGALLAVYLGEVFFCLPAVVIWHVEDAFAKSITIGVLAAAMIRLATIRSIHPTTGFAGVAALASLIVVSNTTYWIRAGNLTGLAFTTMIAVISIGYNLAAIIQNHRQQRLAAISEHVALRATAAKTRFMSQISHELRTPLNAIVGTGTAAFLGTEDPAIKHNLAILLKSAAGLEVMLNDLLDLSAVEEGRISLSPREADIATELGHAVALFRPQAEAAGLALHLQVQSGLPDSLWLDADRLRQCLSNLLSNALKHTEQGQIIVYVRLDPPNLLIIEVQDSGSGVPTGEEERIFNRHDRGSSQRAGHGLGLTICRMLLTQMGGQITLLPCDQGARFQIRLPVLRMPLVLPQSNQTQRPQTAQDAQDLTGLQVMVVDDIATNRLVASTYLGLLGCKTVEAATGAAALTRLENGTPINMVLLDINMPGLDGLATLRLIRAGPAGQVPVVAMTAEARGDERACYLAAGLDGYVSKPLHLNHLRHELVTVLARRSSQMQAGSAPLPVP
ncbi:MAG: ATP-binding protein [Alphaproteobacteria bacterium]